MKTAVTAVLVLLFPILVATAAAPDPVPRSRTIEVPAGLAAADVSFEGYGGLTLHGTVLTDPAQTSSKPGLVLVGGSGAGTPRERLLVEATAFARQGMAVLIYDKRSVGYSKLRRSYSELADDALGAVRTLRGQPGVDPAAVGVWGLSEGGWVAPLAASRSSDVAFVIVVGANAMTPIQQQIWNEASQLRRAGVKGSLIDRAKHNFARWAADAGLFAEAHYDAETVLRQVRQPLLGVWGTRDLQTPPGENPPLFAGALELGGNSHYVFRFFDGADHAAHLTPDGGVTRLPELAPGYTELVGSWISDVTGGRVPDAEGTDAAALPEQDYLTAPAPRSAWWESAWVLVSALGLMIVAFSAYPLVAVVRRLRGRGKTPVSRWARLVAGAGLVAVLGPFVYLTYLMAGRSPDVGPLIAGRPLPWLALQGLAVAVVAAAVVTALAWRRAAGVDGAVLPAERVRLGLLLTGAVVFVPWALYWGLLVP